MKSAGLSDVEAKIHSPKLLMIPPAPVINTDPAHPKLDIKFVEGLKFSCLHWPGKIDVVLREGAEHIPFGDEYALENLPFGLTVLPEASLILPDLVLEYDIVVCSGDSHLDFGLAEITGRDRTRILFVVEYTLQTRLKIAALDRSRSLPRRIWSGLWNIRQEIHRRRAFRKADALQVNGYPAHEAYCQLNADTLLYLDNRMKPDMFATSEDMAARGRHLQGGGPLRLINSGRLEPMKGAQDLVPVAAALRDRGARFTLDIYGTGSLEDRIRQEIVSRDLGDLVTLHAPVDFETELVPISRTGADLFLSCHRQSDPSCTYLEAMGCGLALAGYDNQMLTGLLRASGGGWSVPTGNVDALAARIATIAAGPDDLLSAMRQGLEFATGHGFFDEFTRRNEHMMSVVGAVALPVPSEPG